MFSKAPTILIIGGGWHTPRSYGAVTKELELANYDVHVPTLPSMNGSRPPNADLTNDTDHVRSVAEALVNEGHSLVVFMHSYGGQVGTNALHGLGQQQRHKKDLPGGMLSLIYLAAYAIPEGKAMIDGVRHFGHEQLMPLAFDFADDMTCVSRDPKTLLVGENDLPAAVVEEYLAGLVRWNGQAMYQCLTTPRAAWRDIPVTYIHTTKDMTVPFEYQKWFVGGMEEEGVEVQTATLETGHCANFTAAKQVAKIIEEVAKGSLQSDKNGVAKGTSKDDVKEAILDMQG